jgi:hypothetical protein
MILDSAPSDESVYLEKLRDLIAIADDLDKSRHDKKVDKR